MATITGVKDRTTGSCTGFIMVAFEVHATDGGHVREYRIREWAYKGVWQFEQLKDGAAGSVDSDYLDLGEFPSKQAAMDFIVGSEV